MWKASTYSKNKFRNLATQFSQKHSWPVLLIEFSSLNGCRVRPSYFTPVFIIMKIKFKCIITDSDNQTVADFNPDGLPSYIEDVSIKFFEWNMAVGNTRTAGDFNWWFENVYKIEI